jgi:hypothetical protein
VKLGLEIAVLAPKTPILDLESSFPPPPKNYNVGPGIAVLGPKTANLDLKSPFFPAKTPKSDLESLFLPQKTPFFNRDNGDCRTDYIS